MRVVHVVAAAIIDARDRVLIAQRLTGKHLAGGWEFPGGKLEPGEERRTGLARELKEELGVEVAARDMRPLMRVRHPYPTRTILLDTFVVRRWRGEPTGIEGQPLRWCPRAELGAAGLLPADAPIVAALALPERLLQPETDVYVLDPGKPPAADGRLPGALCADGDGAASAAAQGARLVALRRRLDDDELRAICDSLYIPVYAHGIELEDAWSAGATGINELR